MAAWRLRSWRHSIRGVGSEAVEFALVHGAYHGPWCWDLLEPELLRRGHSVVAVDMPIEDPGAGTGAYADAATAAIQDMERPIVVGHSMGGLVIPLVATVRPVARLVFLAGFLPDPGSSLADQRSREAIDPDFEPSAVEFTDLGGGVFEVGGQTATEMFFYDIPPTLRDWAVSRLRPQGYVFMDETTPLETWPDCESDYIVCRDDHAINPDWGRNVASKRLGVRPFELDGGHSPFLGRPSELADLLTVIADHV